MSPTKQDPPSLKAIAKACRLSSSTVSRALNMSEEDCPLKPGTRARVRRVAKKMGYQGNAHARALSSGRSNTAGLVFSGSLPHFDGVYQSLIAANTRIANLLRQSGDADGGAINADLFEDKAEQTLHGALATVSAGVADAVARADYTAALDQLATLREPVDAFFDDVLVMAEDEAVKRNRLALLTALRAQFLQVADISLAAQ